MSNRRDFLRYGALTAGALAIAPALGSCTRRKTTGRSMNGALSLSFFPYDLQLKHVFTIALSSRRTTPVMIVELEYDGVIGYGEASMPPYLGESQETAAKFLSNLDMAQFKDPFLMEEILEYVDKSAPGNYAAKASVDIALHDLTGKLIGQPWYKVWGFNPANTPYTSFTIGIDTPDVVRQKVHEAEPYQVLKVKLGLDTDKEMIETIRSVSDKHKEFRTER